MRLLDAASATGMGAGAEYNRARARARHRRKNSLRTGPRQGSESWKGPLSVALTEVKSRKSDVRFAACSAAGVASGYHGGLATATVQRVHKPRKGVAS